MKEEKVSQKIGKRALPGNENQQQPRPAGEAPGSVELPEEQGGSHLPAVEQPAAKSLTDQFDTELQDVPVRVPVTLEEPHKCSICSGPDHRACGCEAKAGTNNNLEKELDREDANTDRVREGLEKMVDELSKDSPEIFIANICSKAGAQFAEDMQSVKDRLSDINSNLEALVSLGQERSIIMKGILDGTRNQN